MTKVYSTDEEVFNSEDLEELLLEKGDTYYEGVVVEILPSELLWGMDFIVENMQEQLYDRLGEVAENFEPSDKQKEKVFEALKLAVDTHFDVGCWGVKDIEELTYEEA